MNGKELINSEVIQGKIHTIRGVQVMLDSDLAVLYGVEVKRLNEQVKRNIERFPEKYCFQLSKEEMQFLRSQIVTLNDSENLKSQFATSSWGGKWKMELRAVVQKRRSFLLTTSKIWTFK